MMQRFLGGALVWVCEVNPLKHFGIFTSGEKINSLKQKELCKQIYFEYNLNANMLKNFFFED